MSSEKTNFLGISFVAIGDIVVAVGTGAGDALVKMYGLTSQDIFEFLWSIKLEKERRRVFVSFDYSIDIELFAKDMPESERDRLFGLSAKAEEKAAYETPELATPELFANADHAGFNLSYAPGKMLRLAKLGYSRMTLYDIHAYFEGCDLNQAVAKYLPDQQLERVEKNSLPLWRDGMANAIAQRVISEAKIVTRLAEKVENTINPLGLTPRHWYGPAAIASHCLSKWKARRQSKILKETNSPILLIKAIDCGYVGGRVEQVKLGTIQDVRTYDLNSAYAYAITLLSQFYTPLRFTRKYFHDNAFSLWDLEYELPKTTLLGLLPNRSMRGGISFPRKGRGWFWQPEAQYIIQHFPDCVNVRQGYVGPEYKPVTFAGKVREMYDYRNILKEQGDNGEKIVKLALSNLYGKFAQNKGAAFYQCRAWAGWITSLVRRLMLEAVTGTEDKVICFCQDAIHAQGVDLQVETGVGLGEWKREQYVEGLYLAPGIYRLQKEQVKSIKSASRGSNLQVDFERLANDLSEKQITNLTRSFFVGYQLANQNPVVYGQSYLSDVSEDLSLVPGNLKARQYFAEFDWLTQSRSSNINQGSFVPSARYVPQEFQGSALRLRLKDQGWK